MKKRITIILGIFSILVCIYGLFRYRVMSWLLFLALGLYLIYSTRPKKEKTDPVPDPPLFSNDSSKTDPEPVKEKTDPVPDLSSFSNDSSKTDSEPVKGKTDPVSDPPSFSNSSSRTDSEPEKGFNFPIVGVTFKNDDGTDRQKLLRKILFKDPPFNTDQHVYLERYIWKGEPAYYIKVNDYIVGNIEAALVWYFEKNADRPYKIENIEVYGGGNGKKFGAEIHGVYLDSIKSDTTVKSKET